MDYFRATFQRKDAIGMHRAFGDQHPKQLGKPQGYRKAEQYASGWVRQFDPISPNRAGLMNYETWELPGSVLHDDLRFICDRFPTLKLKQCHIALDFIEQGYPSPWELRELLKDSNPRTKSKRGRRFEGDDGSQTWYLGKKTGTIMLRSYQKGMQLRSTKENPIAPLDWTRCEFELHEDWILDQAWAHLKDDRLIDLAVQVSTYFFEGDTRGLLPHANNCELKPPSNEYKAEVIKLYHLLKQWGPLLQAADEAEILGPLMSLVKPSRTAEWRNKQIIEAVDAEGLDSVLEGISKMLHGKEVKHDRTGEVPF